MSRFLILAMLLLAACAKTSEEPAAPSGKALNCEAHEGGEASVSGAWLREQQDASGMSAAYFTLCNGSMEEMAVTGVSTPAAGETSMHETTRNEAGLVSMAPLGEFTLKPGERVVFEPGGKHLMLMGLAGPIEAGATSSLTFSFAGGKTLTADAVVKSAVEAASETPEEEPAHDATPHDH